MNGTFIAHPGQREAGNLWRCNAGDTLHLYHILPTEACEPQDSLPGAEEKLAGGIDGVLGE